LKRLTKNGTVEKLTSQFPSTTAAHITTIHTGLPVGQSGVYEWFYYDRNWTGHRAAAVFLCGDDKRDTLKDKIKARKLYPNETIYQELRPTGVNSYVSGVWLHAVIILECCHEGCEAGFLQDVAEALVNFGIALGIQAKPHIHFYFEKIDSICHEYGPTALQTEAEIEAFFAHHGLLF